MRDKKDRDNSINGDPREKYVAQEDDRTPHEENLSNKQLINGKEKRYSATEEHVSLEDLGLGNKKTKEKSKEDNRVDGPRIGFLDLFRYTSCGDKVLLCLGTLFAIITGWAFPFNFLVYGKVTNAFILNAIYHNVLSGMNGTIPPNNFTTPNGRTIGELRQYEDVADIARHHAIWFSLIAVGSFVFGFLGMLCYSITAQHQIYRIRQLFFQSLIRQHVGWFDTHDSGTLSTRFTEDMHLISDGTGEKFAAVLQWISTFIASYVIALISGWKLSLVTIGLFPVIIILGACLIRQVSKLAEEESKAYAKAGSVAEEVLGGIRTVMAFNGQDKECSRYDHHLSQAKASSVKKGLFIGLNMGIFWMLLYATFSITFWYGIKLVQQMEVDFDPGSTVTVYIGVMMGSVALGQALPNLEVIASARGAAQKIFEVIELTSEIDPISSEGQTLDKVEGKIEFRNVDFDYPARSDVAVLRGLNVTVKVGHTVALVGSSGCGKTTIIQLLQRFYNTLGGQILLDGCDISSLNVNWLRTQIGVVSQEPVLFATTIAENIRYGRLDVTMEEIETAAMEANAHSFISEFPNGYETLVGDRGAQMSGGQKQRIAIARALVRNPRILLLDEATSALDNESESLVQRALEKAQKGRTTIIVAHRLSTIRNADIIYGIQDGRVVEQGTHKELMQEHGLYSQLVIQQSQELDTTEEDKFVHQLRVLSDESTTSTWPQSPGIVAGELQRDILDDDVNKESMTLIDKTSQPQPIPSQKGENRHEIKLEDEDKPEAPLTKILRMNSPEWPYILGACICSTIAGAIQPSLSFILAEFLKVFTLSKEEQNRTVIILVCIMIGIAVFNAIIRLIMCLCYALAGAKLTARLRRLAFKAVIWQDMPYFDDPNNSVGALTTRLARDASLVQGATGNKVGTVMEGIATATSALTIAFVYSWKLTLVTLAFMPLMVISSIIQVRTVTGFSRGDKEITEKAGKLTTEAIDNIRTVASLTREQSFIDKYNSFAHTLYTNGKKRGLVLAVVYAFSQCVMFFAFAAVFSFGGYLVQYDDLPFENVFKVFGTIIFGGMSIGRHSTYAPDYVKGKMAAARLFQIIESKPTIDTASGDGVSLERFSGSISVDNVRFRYPARPEVEVLRGLSIDIQPGETVAIVGTSGCGKSTTVHLLQRFYDPDSGRILADNNDIKSLNLKWFRSQIGIVSQEPCLFDCSIAENIAYGDNSRAVHMEEIIFAARQANIHSFIDSLPHGYDTNVGEKGTQLSGGQKQRVAIARALVRNPRILLLDEATSSLDTENERIVQEALDNARAGRTCLVIAHRLSTIQNAHRIAILHMGEVVELGSHSELLARKGIYYKLNQYNTSKKTDL